MYGDEVRAQPAQRFEVAARPVPEHARVLAPPGQAGHRDPFGNLRPGDRVEVEQALNLGALGVSEQPRGHRQHAYQPARSGGHPIAVRSAV
jgi:hypothetical protein